MNDPHPGASHPVPGHTRPLWRRMLGELSPYMPRVILYCLVLLGSASCTAAVPLLIGRLVDDGLVEGNHQMLVLCGVAAALLGVIGSSGAALGNAQGMVLGINLVLGLRERMFAHLQSMPLAFFTHAPAGGVQSRITAEISEIQQFVSLMFGAPAAHLIAVIVALVAMASISPTVTLVVVLLAVPVFPFMRFAASRVHARARQQSAAGGAMTAHIAEHTGAGAAQTRILFGHHDVELAEARKLMTAYARASARRNLTFARSSLVLTLFSSVGGAIVYLLGGLGPSQLSVGSVVALAALVGVIHAPITGLATSGISLAGGVTAFERVYDLLDHQPRLAEPAAPVTLPRPVSEIALTAVTFTHPRASDVVPPSLLGKEDESSNSQLEPTLRDISFRAVPGGVTALVGRTGAGKSTVASLLTRLHDPDEGVVQLDGVDLRRLRSDDLHARVAMVTQDSHLINASLRANLLRARPDASDPDLLHACRAAALDPDLTGFADGLDTVVGDGGHRLSGGERQRVALARVLLARPDVVILDEATAHLDNRTEQAIHRAITTELAGCTRVVIAHRLATVVEADQIIVLDHGRLVEQGTHTELLAANGHYRQLYDGAL